MSSPQSEREKAPPKAAARAIAEDMTALLVHAGAEDLEDIRREIHERAKSVRSTPDRKRKQRARDVLKELGLLKIRRRVISPAAGDSEAEAMFAVPSEPGSQPAPAQGQFDRILSAPDMAHRLGMSKPTLFKQMRAGQLVGWFDQRNRGCFPADQLDQFGRVTPGIPQILAQFSDSMAAWWWLTGARHSLDDRAPLDLLKSGEVERALDAARGQAMGAFG